MEERERMLDTIMAMQEFNIKKDKQIEELEQENQELKNRWQELKDLLILFYTVGKTSGINGFEVYNAILDKMQELEKED